MTDQQPLLSVDVIPTFVLGIKIHFVVGRRLYEPFLNEYALPGVLLGWDETIQEGIFRALRTKTKISKSEVAGTFIVNAFDSSNRDPRGATVSIAYLACLTPTENLITLMETPGTGVRSYSLEEYVNGNVKLPFDHNDIVRNSVATISEIFLNSYSFTRALLGEHFTTKTVKTIIEQLQETTNHTHFEQYIQNMNRNLKNTGWVTPINNPDSLSLTDTLSSYPAYNGTDRYTSKGRPATVWEWVDEK